MQQSDSLGHPEVDAFVAEAKRLRSAAVSAAVDYMAFLRNAELRGIHERAGCTFDRLLVRADLIDPARYRDFVRAEAQLGLDTVRTLGLDPAIKVVSIPADAVSAATKEPAREAAIKEIVASAQRIQTPVSERHAKTIVSHHYVPPKRATEESPLERAQRENRQLRARISDLESERESVRAALGPARYDEIVSKSRQKTTKKKPAKAATSVEA